MYDTSGNMAVPSKVEAILVAADNTIQFNITHKSKTSDNKKSIAIIITDGTMWQIILNLKCELFILANYSMFVVLVIISQVIFDNKRKLED